MAEQHTLLKSLFDTYGSRYDVQCTGEDGSKHTHSVPTKIDCALAELQLHTFRRYMNTLQITETALEAAADIIIQPGDSMSEFAKLAAIHQVLPFVSVDGEKSFATLRAVKTKVRNSLGEGDKWENLNIVVRGMSAGKEIGDWNYRGIGDPVLF